MAQTSTEKCGIKADIENKAVSVTSSIHLKRHSFKDLIISDENMSKLYRSSNTTNMPNNFSWVIPNILGEQVKKLKGREIESWMCRF